MYIYLLIYLYIYISVNPNIAKILELTGNKTKTESRCQFSNKEINVRKHGYLVQLILTPSSSTKIRNALTLQVK